jgi:hypothetical protein
MLAGLICGTVVGLLIGPLTGVLLGTLCGVTSLADPPTTVGAVWLVFVLGLVGAIAGAPWASISRWCPVIGAGVSMGLAAAFVIYASSHSSGSPSASSYYVPLLFNPVVSAAISAAVAATKQGTLVDVLFIDRL